jgi:hypothetical protein
MRWLEFIFSAQKKFVVSRHLAFWAAWCIYFLLCFYVFRQPIADRMVPFYLTPGVHSFIKTCLLLALFAAACYPLIYFILPIVIKGNWLKAILYFITICTTLFFGVHLLYWEIFSAIDAVSGAQPLQRSISSSWPAINLGLMNFAKVASAAVVIKYIKYWWLKQKENERLQKEKIVTELQLLKAQVQPDFLFKTLNNIYAHALASSPQTSSMVLKLSELLSYMLYECGEALVPLDKELAMMREYISLEKIRYHPEPEIQVNIKGDLVGNEIAPFLLLPFIESSFRYAASLPEQFWINMDIRVEGSQFSMKLSNGFSANGGDHHRSGSEGLKKAEKRLALLYPGAYELKMVTEQEMHIVLLSIWLDAIKTNIQLQGWNTVINNNKDLVNN